jgi:hypothetical protein
MYDNFNDSIHVTIEKLFIKYFVIITFMLK